MGGTFNPIHRGHLLLAEGAGKLLRLDLLLWIPAHRPPHKELDGRVSAADRARLVEMAIRGHPTYRLSRVELDRPPPSYTIDTVRRLRQEYPGKENRWFFLVGSENGRELPKWREIGELRRLVQFVAVRRPGDPVAGHLPAWVRPLPVATANISSSQVRQRIRQGLEIRHLVPEPVARAIEQKGFYR